MEFKNLNDNQVEAIEKVQKIYNCSFEEAYEIWNEDTTYLENGE